jgi:hypothetical protein
MASPDNHKDTDNEPEAEVAAIEADIEDARARVANSISTLGDKLTRAGEWREQVREHPLIALGVALAGGYALGGGLFTPVTGRLLRAGVRVGVQLALLPAIEREVAALAAKAGESLKGAREERGH